LFTEGNTEEAIYHYNKAIRIKTKYTDAYFNRGLLTLNSASISVPSMITVKPSTLKPHYADAYKNRGSAYFKLAQYQRAIDDYSEAIHLKPDYIDVYINRGLLIQCRAITNWFAVMHKRHVTWEIALMLESPKGREFCR